MFGDHRADVPSKKMRRVWKTDPYRLWSEKISIDSCDKKHCSKCVHPCKNNGWNLKITQLKRKIIFQTFIFFGSMLMFQGVYGSETISLDIHITSLRMFFFAQQDAWNKKSGQISIIPKPEVRGFWGSSLTKPSFRVTSADVVIICPEKSKKPLFFHQKLNGTESQRTPDQVSCETELLDTQVFRGPWNVGPVGPISWICISYHGWSTYPPNAFPPKK